MASKRIWSESTLIWDKAGSELWNVIQQFLRRGNDGDGDADWSDFDDEEKHRMQPAIVVSNLIPDFSPDKKLLFERAGISIGSFNRKSITEDISVFITDIKIK